MCQVAPVVNTDHKQFVGQMKYLHKNAVQLAVNNIDISMYYQCIYEGVQFEILYS